MKRASPRGLEVRYRETESPFRTGGSSSSPAEGAILLSISLLWCRDCPLFLPGKSTGGRRRGRLAYGLHGSRDKIPRLMTQDPEFNGGAPAPLHFADTPK